MPSDGSSFQSLVFANLRVTGKFPVAMHSITMKTHEFNVDVLYHLIIDEILREGIYIWIFKEKTSP